MNLHGINTVVGQKHSTVGMRFIQIPKSLLAAVHTVLKQSQRSITVLIMRP